MSHACAPIGVFDSGLGGLSVLHAIRAQLPHESIVYLADSGYAPYGEKTDAFIRARSAALTRWLCAQRAKMLVVACNTATTHAIASLRSTFALPIVGVEPGVKPAALASGSGVVGVLATAATLRSDRLRTLLATHANHCRVVCQAGHGLVELIEQGHVAGPEMHALLTRYLEPMAQAGADTVILGSTHYALLVPTIRTLFGDRFTLIETGSAIARRVDMLLTEHGLHADDDHAASLRLCSTALDPVPRQALARVATPLAGLSGQATADVEMVDIAMTDADFERADAIGDLGAPTAPLCG
ncbi:glutamate racemase [Trinickia fusca]|uniref:Glutamate racemase n=1 Tax=Trinickia fusca TaxID=2419777 RepID=A0A494X7I3_9BURK|nr:glutamate racemase [Trinickia fusca]RKP45581.1 glutamate racemase [Trinickia fusca]